MAIIGLIIISCILMLFNGGLTGVILLWGFAIWKWAKAEKERQQNLEKWEKAKREFKEKNGYNYPGFM